MNRLNLKKFNRRIIALFILVLFVFSLIAPVWAEDFTFAATCDSRGEDKGVNTEVLQALMSHMIRTNPSVKFLIFPGDMIDGSKKPEKNYQQLLEWKKAMALVYENPDMIWPRVWPSIGNHEVKNPRAESDYLKVFPDVYFNGPQGEKGFTYSFDYKNCHFVSVKTDRWLPPDPEDKYHSKSHYVKHLDWLEEDLESARERGIRHIFVFGHQPAFPISAHIHDSLPNAGLIVEHPENPDRYRFMKIRDRFWDILVKNKVAAYICGHEHVYGRQSVDGVYQILTGGGGAPLYDINPTYDNSKSEHMPSWSPTTTYEKGKVYYEVLGYPHGPGDNCQASPDFVGGRYFQYTVFHVSDDSVTVRTYGVEPKEGTNDQLPDNYKIELKDQFVID